jgi:hypothetical protein
MVSFSECVAFLHSVLAKIQTKENCCLLIRVCVCVCVCVCVSACMHKEIEREREREMETPSLCWHTQFSSV